VHFDRDDVLLWVLEGDGQVAEVLCEFACEIGLSTMSCGYCDWKDDLPLGPSTVMTLVLMATLTVKHSPSAIRSASIRGQGFLSRTAIWNLQSLLRVNVPHLD